MESNYVTLTERIKMRKKKCNKCNQVKNISEFHRFKDMKDGYRNNCKDCQNKTTRLNKTKRGKEYNTEKSRIYRDTNREKIKAYYGGKLTCAHCGLQDECFSVYDFHHINPSEKEERIGVLINRGWERIEEELKKCIVLCANCHRKEHAKNKKS